MTALEDLATVVEGAGLASRSTDPRTLWLDYLPPSPDSVVVLSLYSGLAPEYTQDGGRYDKPSVQLRVRGARRSVTAPRALCQQIADLFDDISNETVNGHWYLWVTPKAVVTMIGPPDENERVSYVCNFDIMKAAG